MRIDIHSHVWCRNGKLDRAGLDGLIDAADRLGIDKMVVSCPVTRGMGDPETIRLYNDCVLEAIDLYPKHLLGYCFAVGGYYREALTEVDRCLDKGMVGVKLYHQYFINDPAMFPLVEKTITERIPILCHAGHCCDSASKLSQPKISDGVHFADIGRRYPEAKIIMAHIGGGGDYEWSLQAIADTPNIYADTSGSVVDDNMIEYAVRLLGTDRVVFGCDETEEGGVGKVLGADLTEAQKDTIFSGNALKILAWRAK